jgi:chaperonin GroES
MKKRETNVAKAKKKSPAAKVKPKAAAKKTAAKKTTAKKVASKPAKKSAAKSPKAKVAKASSASKKTAPASGAAKKSSVPSAVSKTSLIKWENFVTPLDDRLIVEVASGETMTAGGLYIPASVTDVSGNAKGTVLVAGRGHRDGKGHVHPMDVKSGDTVLFAQYAGSKLNLQGKDLVILRETEILGIVDKK